MHRLLVEKSLLLQDEVTLPKEAAHHLKVLRPRPGEEIELFDGCGSTRVYHFNREASRLDTPQPMLSYPRPTVALTLFACVTKGSRWDWTIEKAVELGVSRLVPVISERSIVRLNAAERETKVERWRRVAEDAARQSDAVWLPEIVKPMDFDAAIALVRECGAVFAGVIADTPPMPLLSAVLKVRKETPAVASQGLGVFVGPEGDFSPSELSALCACTIPTSFGPTILRAETAAIFALSVLAAAIASE